MRPLYAAVDELAVGGGGFEAAGGGAAPYSAYRGTHRLAHHS
jgi:hypothetical protein